VRAQRMRSMQAHLSMRRARAHGYDPGKSRVCTMRGAHCSVRASVVRCLTQRSVSSVPCQDGSLGPREHGWGMRVAHALLLQVGTQPLPLQAGTALFHDFVAGLLAGSYIGSNSPE